MAHGRVHRDRPAAGRELRLDRRALLLDDPRQRRAAADRAVAVQQLLEQVGRRRAAAPDVRVVGLDLVEAVGAAVGHEEDGVGGHRDAPLSWTRSTRRARRSGSVPGSTPWPRLNTWPGRPAFWSRTQRAPSSTAGPRPEEEHRVEVALHGPVADEAPALGQGDPPVEADHVPAGRRLEAEDPARPDAEVDRRDADVREALEQAAHPGLDAALVVERAEAADPGVEHLDGLRTGRDLGPQVAQRRLDEVVEEPRPGLGLLVHQPLRRHELARRPALDEVAGERERRPGEADERHRRRGADQPDRLEQRRDGRLGLERAQGLDVLEASAPGAR